MKLGPENAIKLFYKLIDNLLYFNNNERDLCLYIFTIIKIEMFKYIHDKIDYLEYMYVYKRLI